MTRQYLAGEMSVLVAQLRAVSGGEAGAGEWDALRRAAECLPPTELGSVAERAIELADTLCWNSVTRGDTTSFCCQAAAAAELYEFATCAGLLGVTSAAGAGRCGDDGSGAGPGFRGADRGALA